LAQSVLKLRFPARPRVPAAVRNCGLEDGVGAGIFPAMSTVAEIEAVVPQLSIEELEELERFVHKTRLEKKAGPAQPACGEVRLISHHFGVNPAIDLNKLGQISEDF
jgi:hypothetical protein